MKKRIMIGAVGLCMAAGAAMAQDAPIVRPSSRNIKDLQIRGRIQTQFGFVQAENDEMDESWSTAELRRVRLGLRGTLFQSVRAQLEANVVPGSGLSMRSAFLEWRENPMAYVKFGLDKPKFGFEENTSSAEILTVERTVLTGTFAPGQMNGLSVSGATGMVSYGAGAYTDSMNRNRDNATSKYAVNGSAELNLDALAGQRLRLRADYLASNDTAGNFGARFENALSGSVHFAAGAFDLRAEYITGDNLKDETTSGFYVMPSWRFTEKLQGVLRYEQATSDNRRGLRPPSRYVRRAPGLEPVTTEFADGTSSTRDPTRGDEYSALYIGGTYYLAGHNQKLMFGVELSELENTVAGTLKGTSVYGAWRMLF